MKYEEIEVGEVYNCGDYTEKVLFKHDETRQVVTIDEHGEIYPFFEGELEAFQPIKKELPKTGLLINEDGTMMFRTGETTGYGFFSEDRFYSGKTLNFKTKPEIWKAATKQEEVLFKSWVKEELVKRDLIKGTRFKSLLECNIIHEIGDGFSFNEDGIFSDNNCIFYQGVWAEPLMEESLPPFKPANYNSWVETYSKLMAGDFMIRGDFSSRMDFAKKAPQEKNTEERIKQSEEYVSGNINELPESLSIWNWDFYKKETYEEKRIKELGVRAEKLENKIESLLKEIKEKEKRHKLNQIRNNEFLEERIKKMEREFNSRIEGLIKCFHNITKWDMKHAEEKKEKLWWRSFPKFMQKEK